MPKLIRRAGPLGLALSAYDLWKKLPEAERRKVLEQVRTKGPKVAATAVRLARGLRAKP